MRSIIQLSDKKLYELCQQYGERARFWRQKFTGLLPEVYKRKLYLRHAMHDIYEFSAKLASINRETVNEVLRIHRLLNTAPILREKLVSGEIPYTKLRVVAPVVTKENQEIWLKKVETMSRPTLEVYVREMKKQMIENERQSGEKHRTGILPVLCGLPWKAEEDYETLSLKVNRETAAKMRVFKQRLEKKFRKPLNWDEALREILQLAEKKTRGNAQKKAQNNAESTQKIHSESIEKTKTIRNHPVLIEKLVQPIKRYIPAAIRNQVLEKNHGICETPGCNKPGEIFHHVERFALKPEHHPEKIRYLCKAHERIAHHSLIKNEEGNPDNWELLSEPDKNHPKYFIDSLVQKFRMGIKEEP